MCMYAPGALEALAMATSVVKNTPELSAIRLQHFTDILAANSTSLFICSSVWLASAKGGSYAAPRGAAAVRRAVRSLDGRNVEIVWVDKVYYNDSGRGRLKTCAPTWRRAHWTY
eukprot:352544-Chlamydomonas_euryale.AAC.11